jgi:DHA3 family tetracycline resistance protein-like MFS transporter
MAMVFSVSSIYHINMVHLKPLQLVLVGTVLEITHFIFEIPTGIFADSFSRKICIIIGLFLVGIGLIIEGAFPFFIIILLAQVIWGMGDTFSSRADNAWIVDELAGDKIDSMFLKSTQFGQVNSIGQIIGGPLYWDDGD